MKSYWELKETAVRYRRLASTFSGDQKTVTALIELAEEYEAVAVELERQPAPSGEVIGLPAAGSQ